MGGSCSGWAAAAASACCLSLSDFMFRRPTSPGRPIEIQAERDANTSPAKTMIRGGQQSSARPAHRPAPQPAAQSHVRCHLGATQVETILQLPDSNSILCTYACYLLSAGRRAGQQNNTKKWVNKQAALWPDNEPRRRRHRRDHYRRRR